MAHWVLQNNLWHERGWEDLRHSVERLHLPHTEVKVVPFVHELEPPHVLQNAKGPVVVVGSTSLVKAALKRNWKPGAWYNEATLRFDVQREYYGDLMLNYEGVVLPLKNIPKMWEHFFIRPNLDTKSFAGEINSWEEFAIWRQQIQVLGECWGKTIQMDDLVVMAPIRKIAAEYRLFVVDKQVVTGSRYKMGNRVVYEPLVDDIVLDLANDAIKLFCPVDAFAIDIAITEDGDPRILEINCINSSGLYAADTMKLVHALDELANASF